MKQKNIILMVVAVGCGLVAAFLTSQMSAKSQVEQVEVLVAAKDLPVGTTITRDDLDKFVKTKKLPKDGLPPAFVVDREQLVDKRLSRPVRAEETFNPQDLLKGGAITLPPGYNMVALPVGVGQAAAGFVGPGSRVDVLATVRIRSDLKAFPLLVNMLVVAVDTKTTYEDNKGVFPTLSMVSFAVKGKEALLLSLARARGCTLELMLRHPEANSTENNDNRIDEIIKLISDEKAGKGEIKDEVGRENPEGKKVVDDPKTEIDPKTQPGTNPVKPGPEPKVGPEPAPAPTIALVKVPVAKQDIEPNTLVTNDLIKEAFEWQDLPKDFAADAVLDMSLVVGKTLKHGLAKKQWVTYSMIGVQQLKPSPQDTFTPPKPGPGDPVKPVEPKVVKPAKKPTHDVAVHTANGTTIHRYEEVTPGVWKKIAELTPEQAAKEKDPKPGEPEAAPAPGDRKVD
jgi:Flp pilus assembly protein CpaB